MGDETEDALKPPEHYLASGNAAIRKAFKLGQEARRQGKSENENPYLSGGMVGNRPTGKISFARAWSAGHHHGPDAVVNQEVIMEAERQRALRRAPIERDGIPYSEQVNTVDPFASGSPGASREILIQSGKSGPNTQNTKHRRSVKLDAGDLKPVVSKTAVKDPEIDPDPLPDTSGLGILDEAEAPPKLVQEHGYLECHKELWKGRDLCVLFPCYKYTNPATAWALVAIALDLGRDKVRFDQELGDAMIYHARNKLATRFLETGATWSLWIDDDIIPPIGRAAWFKWIGNTGNDYTDEVANRHVVTRLMSHGKSIVGGTYFGRQATGRTVFSGFRDAAQDQSARRMDNRIIPVDWIGTGCLLVHRQVYLDIQKKFPELAPKAPKDHWDFFLPMQGKGEDVSFCERARAAGHQVWLDTGLQCLHVGYSCYGPHNTGKEIKR